MEKEDKNDNVLKKFNNDFIIQKLKEDTDIQFNNDNNMENNNEGVMQLYKNLENKFDILEKAIEEGKKNKYDFINEENKDIDLYNNNIILTNFSNNIEYEKNNFLEGLYKNEKIMENKKEKKISKKKKKPLTKIIQNNLKNNKGNNKLKVLNDENKNKKNYKNNLKIKK